MEPGVQTPDFTLRTGIGSCRDSAWLLVSILRQLGLAARFVSGYLVQLTSDVEALDGPSGPAADFTDLHAWTEVYIPGAGWIGLDPTSGLFAGEGHIPLSATPHPASAAPITGATEPCETTLDFSNIVTRVHEDPRVTLPYTEAAWGAIDALGARVDERLADGDVRLTVGGEPTFVSIDNQVDPEWTTDADGPHKRERASVLAARLKKVWAPQRPGAAQPGQVVSRENRCRAGRSACIWRTDGEPLWTRRRLLADPWPSRGGRLDRATADADAGRAVLDRHRRRARPARHPGAARLRGRAGAGWPRGAATRRRSGRHRRTTSRTTRADARAALLARLDEPVDRARRLRAAAAPPRRRLRLGQRRLAAAPRTYRAARRGFAGRAAAAAGLDQLAAAAADVRRRPADRARRRCPAPDRRHDGRRGRGRRRRAHHRDGRRGPRRAAVRLPAAHRRTGPLRRPGHPDRGRGRQGRLPGGHRGLRAAAATRGSVDVRHPRPRRHRGQRRARPPASPSSAHSWRRSTSRPGWPGCPPSRSTSTAPTAAPAAATTSPWAVSRPPIRRCCAVPTCWCRC